MNIYMSGTMAHVGGDWTLAGVTRIAMDSLAGALQKILPGNAGRLLIDCRDVTSIDSTGQELLSMWMQCVRLRGVEPELLNPPNKLRQALRNLGIRYRDAPRTGQKTTMQQQATEGRRFPHENQ